MRFDVESRVEGYVVVAFDWGVHIELANFGDCQSAAIEFKEYCREYVDEVRARRYGANYRGGVKFDYPIIRGERCDLRRQRFAGDVD